MPILSPRTKGQKKRIPDTIKCSKCGSVSNLIDNYPNRPKYKCESCGLVSADPSKRNVLKNSYEEKVSKSKPSILVRDRSSEFATEKDCSQPVMQELLTKKVLDENSKKLQDKNLECIKDAMSSKKLIEFQYEDSMGKVSLRSIEPYKLTYNQKKNEYVIFGFCLEKEAIRAFSILKMSNCKKQGFQFDPRWPIEDQTVGV